MKTCKMVLGIINCVLFVWIMFQSCAANVSSALTETEDESGMYGFVFAFILLGASIAAIATKNITKPVPNIIICLVYFLAAFFAYCGSEGIYKDLSVWSGWAGLCGFQTLFTLRTEAKENKNIIKHIFYCPSCREVFSGSEKSQQYCPDCKHKLQETTILSDNWRTFNENQKDEIRKGFDQGFYLRSLQQAPPKPIQAPQTPAADPVTYTVEDIKQYKELLDMGAITQEEYDTLKKKFLKM